MNKEYIKRLLQLSKELDEQVEAEREDDPALVPFVLVDKIKYLCGYIDALKENKSNV